MKRLKSPYITSSESFLSQIKPTDSADEASISGQTLSWKIYAKRLIYAEKDACQSVVDK
jgi:hypothetical protein